MRARPGGSRDNRCSPLWRLPLLLAGVVALASLYQAAAAGAAAPSASTTQAPWLLRGANIEYDGSAEIQDELAAAMELHAQVVRVPVRWSQLEPFGAGRLASRPLALLDQLVSTASADGIKLIMVVDGTPCWASSAPESIERDCTPGRRNEANAWPPREPSAYAAFVAYLAQRYGASLAAIEIWNEPDQANQLYLAGPEKAAHYAALLKAAYPAIKSVAPQVPVLGGSFVGPNGTFLRLLYANGIKGYYDGLAVHFYTLTLAALRITHEVQLQNGDTEPLWLSEFGWSSCLPGRRVEQEQACVTPAVQAANLVNLTRSLARLRYVAAEVFYKLRNSPQEEFGVVTMAGGLKTSFGPLSRAFVSPLGNPSPVVLNLRRHAGRVIASGSAPVGDFLELEVLKHGKLRYQSIFTLDNFDRYTISLPRVLGTHGLLVRVFEYGEGVRRATRRHV
jgi:hypothetical protein